MASHTQAETHPVLLAIAGAAFLVLFVIGVNLFTKQSGHSSVGQVNTHTPVTNH